MFLTNKRVVENEEEDEEREKSSEYYCKSMSVSVLSGRKRVS